MRVCYVLLSSTFGMHQYTADLANRMAANGHHVHLVTTKSVPQDRYVSSVEMHTLINTTGTGLSLEALRPRVFRRVLAGIKEIGPDVVHFSGPHLWNVLLVRALKAYEIPVIHSLHDLDPHYGTRYGVLLRLWNRLIAHSADHILVHGHTYRQRLLAMGLSESQVTWTPLLHLFVGSTHLTAGSELAESIEYETWALFFGRLERYKGVDHLIAASALLGEPSSTTPRVVIAGAGDVSSLWAGSLPDGIELRNHLIDDDEAIDLFRRCGLVVLPYVDATQSALIAAAYYFRKPVVVTHAGALSEYVEDGITGHVIEAGHPAILARRLDELLDDPDRLAQMGDAGRAWYEEHRALEELSIVQMYRRLVHPSVSLDLSLDNLTLSDGQEERELAQQEISAGA